MIQQSHSYRQAPVVKNNQFRQQFNIPLNDRICIYQGILAEGRGINALLKAFADIGHSWHIVFMGFGPAEPAIRQASQAFSNIHYQPTVSPQDIISYTASADIGLFFVDHQISLSYRYCLPNKFFEYVYGGCAVIVSSNLEHLSDIVNEFEIGWSVSPDVETLCTLLAQLDDAAIRRSCENAVLFAETNSWEDDEQNLIAVFDSLSMSARRA